MKANKKRNIVFIAFLLVISFIGSISAQALSDFFVINNVRYSADFVKNEKNVKFIRSEVEKSHSRGEGVKGNIDGKWYEIKNGEEKAVDMSEEYLFLNEEGKFEQRNKNGYKTSELVIRSVGMNSENIVIHTNMFATGEDILDNTNYWINGENPKKEDVKQSPDGKGIYIRRNTGVKKIQLKIEDSAFDMYKMGFEKDQFSIEEVSTVEEMLNSDAEILVVTENNLELSRVVNIDKDIFVSGNGVLLKNFMLKGRVILDPGSEGTAVIEDVSAGEVLVESGASESIHIKNSEISKLAINSEGNTRVALEEKSSISNLFVQSIAQIENSESRVEALSVEEGVLGKVVLKGSFKKVTVKGTGDVELLQGEIELLVAHNKFNLRVEKDAKIEALVSNGNEVEIDGEVQKSYENIDSVPSNEGTEQEKPEPEKPEPEKPEPEQPKPVDLDGAAVLVGSFVKEIDMGNDWDPSNSKLLMNRVSEYEYEIALDMKAGEYEYKVAMNGSWDESYGQDGNNRKINIDEDKKVIFSVNTKEEKVIDSVNNADEIKAYATLVGSFKNIDPDADWNPGNTSFDLSYIGNGFFKGKFQLTAGDYEYKVAYDHKWSNGETGSNQKISLPEDREIEILASAEGDLCVDSVNNADEFYNVSLIGTIRNSGDDNWKDSLVGFEFVEAAKNIYVFDGIFQEGSYEYKGIENYSWDGGGVPNSGNIAINIPEGGKYVQFVLDRESGNMYDTINTKEKVEEALKVKEEVSYESPIVDKFGRVTFNYKNDGAQNVYVAGSFNGWSSDNEDYRLQKDENGIWSITVQLEPGDFEYKFVFDGNWTKDPKNDKESNGNSFVHVQEFFKSLIINEDGSITFRYEDKSGNAEKVFLAGSMTNWGDGRELMEKDENNIWSITKKLSPGKYQYKFIVGDNGWTIDPANPNLEGDNSLAVVPGFYSIDFPTEVLRKTTTQAIAMSMDLNQKMTPIHNNEMKWELFCTTDSAIKMKIGDKATSSSIYFNVNDEGSVSIFDIPKDINDLEFILKGAQNGGEVREKLFKVVDKLNEVPGGRQVVLVGSIQTVIGEAAWTPGSDATRMLHRGDGLYEITLKDVPAGGYEYKIAMGSWDENYGENGKADGPNMKITVPETMDVTFWYSDKSHQTQNSVSYSFMDVYLTSDQESKNIKMLDKELSGTYSAEITLNKGTYGDFKVTADGKTIEVPEMNITKDNTTFKIFFNPDAEMVYNDLSGENIDESKVEYDSRDIYFKKPFGAVEQNQEIQFRIKTGKDVASSTVSITGPEGSKSISMTKEDNGEGYLWTGNYTPVKTGTYDYYFIVSNGSKPKAYGDDDGYFGKGKVSEIQNVAKYQFNVYMEGFKTPDWMKEGLVYQIFPDRFFNGDVSNDEAQAMARGDIPYEFYKDWYRIPENPNLKDEPDYVGDGHWHNEMYGGDIAGIQKKLDYLEALGITVLYLNPVSASISSHRYDATDYREVDPLLGTMEEFEAFTAAAEERGMKVVLDGVFNHVSDDSVYFDRYNKYKEAGKPLGAYLYWSRVYDIMNNDNVSEEDAIQKAEEEFIADGITDFHYAEWFEVKNKKVGEGKWEHYDYEGWWGFDSMPVIAAPNGSEYNIESWRDEIIDGEDSNTRMWLKKGSDGWRLDVANEVSDETWQNFRKAVKEEGDNVIIGEIWDDATKYILGDMYDSVMNYRFRDAVMGFVRNEEDDPDAEKATLMLEKMREQYPREAFDAMLNLVDSHDVPRIISTLDGVKKDQKITAPEPTETAYKKMRVISLIQMTYEGAPCIYYGDEIGTAGAHDPDNRRTAIWGKGSKELVEWYAKMGNIRNSYDVLKSGNTAPRSVNNSDVFAFDRYNENNLSITLANRSENVQMVVVDSLEDGVYTDAITGKEYTAVNGEIQLEVPSYGGIILVKDYIEVTIQKDKLVDGYAPEYIVPKKQ